MNIFRKRTLQSLLAEAMHDYEKRKATYIDPGLNIADEFEKYFNEVMNSLDGKSSKFDPQSIKENKTFKKLLKASGMRLTYDYRYHPAGYKLKIKYKMTY